MATWTATDSTDAGNNVGWGINGGAAGAGAAWSVTTGGVDDGGNTGWTFSTTVTVSASASITSVGTSAVSQSSVVPCVVAQWSVVSGESSVSSLESVPATAFGYTTGQAGAVTLASAQATLQDCGASGEIQVACVVPLVAQACAQSATSPSTALIAPRAPTIAAVSWLGVAPSVTRCTLAATAGCSMLRASALRRFLARGKGTHQAVASAAISHEAIVTGAARHRPLAGATVSIEPL